MANFFRIGAAGLNWKNTGSWSATSGGASNGVDEPSASDTVTFNASSPATVTVTSAAAGSSLTLNKASLVITLNGGSIVIGGTTTYTTIATVNKTAAETLSTNGLTVNANCLGNATVIITGGTWQGSSTSPPNITLQGTITVSGTVQISSTTLVYTPASGTVTTTGSTLRLVNTCPISTDGVIWNNITTISTVTVTLTSNFACASISLSGINSAIVFNKTASETVTVSNGISLAASSNGGLSGTADIYLTGGTWSSTTIVTGNNGISNNLFLNGTITLGTNVHYLSGTLTYSGGSITTSGNTLNLITSCTLATSGVTWNNVTLTNTNTQTYTINSSFDISGTLTLGTGLTTAFAGTAGWTCATLSNASTAATTITLKEAITYTVTTLLSCFTTRTGSSLLFTSAHGTTKAILTLQNGATCRLLANLTRIDCSNGRTVRSFNGTLTDTLNCVSISDLRTVAA